MRRVQEFRDRQEYAHAVLEYLASHGKEQESCIDVAFQDLHDTGAGYRYKFAATFVFSQKPLLHYVDFYNSDDPFTSQDQDEALSSQVSRLRDTFQGLEAMTVFDSESHKIHFAASSPKLTS